MMKTKKIHDYSGPSQWGHNYEIVNLSNDGMEVSLVGWGYGIKNGDYLLLNNGDYSTRYVVDYIKYYINPDDMWSAEASFSPRNTLE